MNDLVDTVAVQSPVENSENVSNEQAAPQGSRVSENVDSQPLQLKGMTVEFCETPEAPELARNEKAVEAQKEKQANVSEVVKKTPKAKDPSGKERVTALLPKSLLETIRDIAYWERMSLTDLYIEGLEYIKAKYGNEDNLKPRTGHLKTGRRPGS